MKKIKQLSKIMLVAFSIIVASCSSDSDSEGGSVSAGEGTISAKVDGNTVTSVTQGTFAYLTSVGLQITGTSMDTKNLAINILAFDGVGKYDIGGNKYALEQPRLVISKYYCTASVISFL